MQVTIEIPDSFAEQLEAAGKDPARAALESLLVEGYRDGHLTSGQIKRALSYGTRMQVHELLAEHGVPLNYGIDELDQDIETVRRLRAQDASAAA
jgi:predicted HTH domain antitoxin